MKTQKKVRRVKGVLVYFPKWDGERTVFSGEGHEYRARVFPTKEKAMREWPMHEFSLAAGNFISCEIVFSLPSRSSGGKKK